jgi:hypothetical protein
MICASLDWQLTGQIQDATALKQTRRMSDTMDVERFTA